MNTFEKVSSAMNGREEKKLGGNTWARYDEFGGVTVAIVSLHGSDIIVAYKDGKTMLDSCGYRTHTTKERMNEWLYETYVYQKSKIWYVSPGGRIEGDTYLFEDGMFIFPDGTASTLTEEQASADIKRLEAMKKKLDVYADNLVNAMFAGRLSPLDGIQIAYAMNGGYGDNDVKLAVASKNYNAFVLYNAVTTQGEGTLSAFAGHIVGQFFSGEELNDFSGAANNQLRKCVKRYLNVLYGFAK